MKQKHLLGSLTLGATLLLASVMTSSCTLNPSDIAKISRDDRPAYLRDSEEWGKVVKQTISTTPFTRIDATGNVDIIFTQASNISVVAEGNEKVLERYDIGTHDGTLYMKYKEQRRGNNNVPTIRLHVSAAALLLHQPPRRRRLQGQEARHPAQRLQRERDGRRRHRAPTPQLPQLHP
jgi:hypothetical protein